MPGTGIKGRAEKAATESKEVVLKASEALGEELDGVIASLSAKVTDVRRSISSASDEGVAAASRGLEAAIKKSRKGVQRLEKKWQSMDTKQKVGVVGGILAVLAAAAATPTIVKKVRGKR